MKRFTETEKWRDPWFRQLSPDHKLLWWYIVDNCDNAGVIELDKKLAEFQIGMPIDFEAALLAFGPRVQVMDNGKWFLIKFVAFQCGTEELSRDCKPHAHIISLLSKHGLNKGYANPIDSIQDKDKDKDKDSGKGIVRGKPFAKPSVDNCRDEAKRLGMPSEEGDAFRAYYESIGWVRGKNQIPIKDWTSLMASWRDNWKQKNSKKIALEAEKSKPTKWL